MISLNSYSDFTAKSKGLDDFWVLIHKKTSEQSDCAFENIKEASKGYKIFTVDVNDVKDIHSKYDVKTVPTLLKFENKRFKAVYKGCNDTSFYKSLFSDTIFSASSNGDNAPKQKSVTVYSTPTCSWCTRIKDYLKANNIRFKDVDVSKDQKAAEAMVKRSGQQGVPQTLIGGQVIVGFDKPKIDKLLGL
ncbi:glutaredoxin domain-containing protein [Lutibacter sp.]